MSISSRPHYFDQTDLARFGEVGEGAPAVGAKFFEWYGSVFAEGALTAREKSLIALAVAHAIPCPYCIDAYTHDALAKGSNLEEMTEAVMVASAIRGGATLVQATQMRAHLKDAGM
jgi:4-carboxymuconolactone decarboxylase